MIEFRDFPVKLVAMNMLLEDGIIQAPYEDGYDWLQATRGLDFDAAEELFYGELLGKMLPEAEEWARNYDLTDELRAQITQLIWDGGLTIFGLLAPSWGGASSLFDPQSWADVTPERFPNLEEVEYYGEMEDSVRKVLEDADIDVSHCYNG